MRESDEPERPTDLPGLFEQAVEIEDPVARAAFLDERCPAPDRAALDALLAAHPVHDARLDRLVSATEAIAPSLTGPSPGRIIGPFTLIDRLGEGGFGEVWRARQESPIARDVALKLIKPGMDSRQVLRRFEAERAALSAMDHPNIARVLDGGLTDRGHPWFAMELIEGEGVVDWCDRRHASTGERLRLFTRVCRAIEHAHQKGILHRDLKPSNVLVTEHDGDAAPKVIDFGIARAVHGSDRDDGPGRALTLQGQFVGTPGYMSPEQAASGATDIDTRSDVYGLGVLLYELLVGRPPFEPADLRQAGLDALLRIVRESNPPKPSTRFASLGTDSTVLAESRGSSPRRVESELRGELDWIVMRCLEKDRDRRYGSASALADDIGRALRREPVAAGPPSLVYRARTFARRHRVIAAFAVSIAISLTIGAAGTVAGLQRAAREWKRAEAGWAEARSNEARARAAASEARWAQYIAVMQIASDAIDTDDRATARASLARAPNEHRGWEHALLTSRAERTGTRLVAMPRHAQVVIDSDRDAVFAIGTDGVGSWRLSDGTRRWSAPVPASLDTEARHGVLWLDGAGDRLLTAWYRVDPDGRKTTHLTLRDTAGQLIHTLAPLDGRIHSTSGHVQGSCTIVTSGDPPRRITIDMSSGGLLSDSPVDDLRGQPVQSPLAFSSPDGRHVILRAPTLVPEDRAPQPRLRIIQHSNGATADFGALDGRFVGFLGPDRFVLQSDDDVLVCRFDLGADGATSSRRTSASSAPGIAERGGDKAIAAGPGWIAYRRSDRSVAVHELAPDRWHRVITDSLSGGLGGQVDVDLATRRLVVARSADGTIHDLDSASDPSVIRRAPAGVRSITPLAGGRFVGVADWSGWSDRRPGSLVVLDAVTGEPRHQLLDAGHRVIALANHPERPILVAWGLLEGTSQRQARHLAAWDWETGERLWIRDDLDGGFHHHLHVTEHDRVLTHSGVFSLEDGERLAPVPAPGFAALMPDQRAFVLDPIDRSHSLVDLEQNSVIRTFAAELPRGSAADVTVSPDGRFIAVSAYVEPLVSVLDLRTDSVVASPGPHGDRVRAAVFHPNGTRLVTACDDGRIRIFAFDPIADRPTFELVGTIRAHDGPITSLAFDRTGSTLYSTGADGLVRRWTPDDSDR